MNTEQFQIIKAFSKGIYVDLTINQISKIIKKSYAFTNKYTHELIELGVLNKRVVGSAILCSLNYSSKKTIASLVYLSIYNRSENLKNYETNALVFKYDNKVYVVESRKKFSGTKSLDLDEFKLMIPALDFSRVEIFNNPEVFWNIVSKVVLR